MAATKPAAITLLHLSDLQFGKNHLFGRTDRPAPDGWYDSLFLRLKEDLESLTQKPYDLNPDLVVLSGDIAECGMKSEFDQALRFLEQLTEYLQLPRRRVVLVPGNHDINRKACEAYFSDCESQEEQPVPPFWPKWREFVRFFSLFYHDEPKLQLTVDEPWTYLTSGLP